MTAASKNRWLIRHAVIGVLICLLSTMPAAHAATLSRGINITAWFRFPASRDAAILAAYLSDPALTDLRKAGFDFVRLAIDPSIVEAPAQKAALITALHRIQQHGFAVIVSPHPHDWHLETNAADRDRLHIFWRTLAPALRHLNPDLTLPEVLNEPVFPNDPAGWAILQHAVLNDIRQVLPATTIVLTGQDWGSVTGLLALTPEADNNVIYSFHFYDPPELTSLAAYRQDLNRAAIARLPFPVGNLTECQATATADPPTNDLIRYYCALNWDIPHLDATINRAATWASQNHARLLAGEFGATNQLNPQARQAWLRTVRQAFETHGIAWALWGYDDIMGLAVSRPPGPRPTLDATVLTALGLTALGLTAPGLTTRM